MELPTEVSQSLRGRPQVGSQEQAFAFVTHRQDGAAHVTLLSRAELEPAGSQVLVALAGQQTPANLARTSEASLLVVAGTTAYTCRLREQQRLVGDGLTGVVMDVVEVRADSLGIPLAGITYAVPATLPGVERWDRSAALLASLRSAIGMVAE